MGIRRLYTPKDDWSYEPQPNYWNNEVRIIIKGENDKIIQQKLDKLGKVCTTCKLHLPFKWFPKDKNNKILARCKFCRNSSVNNSRNSSKKQTRPYNKKKQYDTEFWDKSEAFIDFICHSKRISRENCIKAIFETENMCMPTAIMNFRIPENYELFKVLRDSVPDPKDNYKRGEDIKRKFGYISDYADKMTEDTAREVILSYKEGIRHKKTLVRGALYKLNRREIDLKANSENQKFNILNQMLNNLPLA